MKFLEVYTGCIVIWTLYYFIGKILFRREKNLNKWLLVAIILLFSLVLTMINISNLQIFEGVSKLFISYIMVCIYYNIVFKKLNNELIIGALVSYLFLSVSEALVVIIVSIIYKLFGMESMNLLQNSLLMNCMISMTNYILIRLNSKKLGSLVKNSKFDKISSFIIIIVIIITLALIIIRIPIHNWRFSADFIFTMVLLICFAIIGLIILKQRAEIELKASMYQQLAEYSNITNDILEEYRVVTHEYKNQLLVISGMTSPKNKELKEYVDNLLVRRKKIKYEWIGDLNHIPISGLRGLINYKILEMESLGINTNIYISAEIARTNINKLTIKQKDNLYSMVGIYLDNAMQASIESSEKEVSVEIYIEKGNVIVMIANTYAGELDLNKMDNYGYTTKGKKHGVGLHIVKEIIKNDDSFISEKNLFDNYFIQKLTIKSQK